MSEDDDYDEAVERKDYFLVEPSDVDVEVDDALDVPDPDGDEKAPDQPTRSHPHIPLLVSNEAPDPILTDASGNLTTSMAVLSPQVSPTLEDALERGRIQIRSGLRSTERTSRRCDHDFLQKVRDSKKKGAKVTMEQLERAQHNTTL